MTDFPSYELVQRFMHEVGFDVPDPDKEPAFPSSKYMKLASRLIQYGADCELEACCEVLNNHNPSGYYGEILRTRRRPKPPSLKYQALKSLGHINRGIDRPEDTDIIRRALEQLDD